MRVLNAADVRKALPMRDAIDAMKRAYAAPMCRCEHDSPFPRMKA